MFFPSPSWGFAWAVGGGITRRTRKGLTLERWSSTLITNLWSTAAAQNSYHHKSMVFSSGLKTQEWCSQVLESRVVMVQGVVSRPDMTRVGTGQDWVVKRRQCQEWSGSEKVRNSWLLLAITLFDKVTSGARKKLASWGKRGQFEEFSTNCFSFGISISGKYRLQCNKWNSTIFSIKFENQNQAQNQS